MAATTTHGLSATDLTFIRDTLAAGRKPKVVFTAAAGQISGQLGQVVELTDPAGSDEWIVVRFGKDELPFAPSDVAIPVKTPPARRAESKSPIPPKSDIPYESIPREEAPMPATAKPASPTAKDTPVAASSTPNGGAPANGHVPEASAAAAKPAKAGKVKPPPSLTVTLAYTDREWTVAASQGTKALAKPYVIKPTDALRMVSMLDVPGVHEAVESIIEAERAEAESRAQRLRSELAEIESRISELTDRA